MHQFRRSAAGHLGRRWARLLSREAIVTIRLALTDLLLWLDRQALLSSRAPPELPLSLYHHHLIVVSSSSSCCDCDVSLASLLGLE